jgi:L-asparaginase
MAATMSKIGHVVVVGTGGTIASRYDPALGRTVASQGVEAIVGLAAKPAELPRLTFENFATVAGFNMTLPFIHGLVGRLRELLASSEVDAVVVTQGTDTMEETSFLANLLIDTQKPLVFTGAQLAHDHPQSDGPRNVIDAIHAAASKETQGLGAMVCFNGELHAAREVSKVHTSAIDTFKSYHYGELGIVDGDQVIVYRRPQLGLHLRPEGLDKRVEILKAAIGADGRMVDAARDMEVDGLIIEAFGRGNLSAEFGQAVGRACRSGLPVVITSRCPVGRVQPVYGGGGGGGRDLEDVGAIFAGDLKAPKARLLLIAALGDPTAHGHIRELFATLAP